MQSTGTRWRPQSASFLIFLLLLSASFFSVNCSKEPTTAPLHHSADGVSAPVDDPQHQPVDWTGIANVGIVLVNFDGTPSEYEFGTEEADEILGYMFDNTLTIDGLFREMSGGADGFTGEILAIVEIDTPYTVDCATDRFQWNRAAFAAAETLGVDFDPDSLDIVMFVYPEGNDCSGYFNPPVIGGQAFTDNGNPYIDIPEVGIYHYVDSPTTIAHELGHLRGWDHSDRDSYNDYNDFTCVMGDNYDYGSPGGKIPMRQANAIWKYDAGYISSSDVDTVSVLGTHTFYLAPAEAQPGDWPPPGMGETLRHIVQVTASNDEVFWISYRDRDFTDYGDDNSINPLVDRISVHTKSGNSRLEATLAANEYFSEDNVIITAITDGLTGGDYAEVEVLIWDEDDCEEGFTSAMSEDPIYDDGTVTVGTHLTRDLIITNDNPWFCNDGDYSYSVSHDGGTGWSASIPDPGNIAAGATDTTAVSLLYFVQPPAAPADDVITLTVTVSDPVSSQEDEYEFAFYYDTTNPSTPGGLAAQMTDVDEVTLSWSASSDATSGVANYKVQRSEDDGPWTLVGTPTSPGFVDTPVDIIQKLEYRVRSVDNSGNQSAWSSIVQTGCPKCPPPSGS